MFRIAFDVVDINRNGTISRDEFDRLWKMSSCTKGSDCQYIPSASEDSSLTVHLFGKDRGYVQPFHMLTFPEFKSFLQNFQHEVQAAEFMSYSVDGKTTICTQ